MEREINKRLVIEILILLGLVAAIPVANRLSEWYQLRKADNEIRYSRQATKRINELTNQAKVEDKRSRIDPRYRFNGDDLRTYRAWIGETVDHTRSTGRCALVVDKAAYEVVVFCDGDEVANFPVELGPNPFDDKYLEGDGATPEGRYFVARVRDKGETRFYRALLLDYPNAQDRMKYRELLGSGVIEKDVGPGGYIEIHGGGTNDPDSRINWTLGCIAVANQNIDAIFERYPPYEGMPVTVVRYGANKGYREPL